MIPKRVAAAKEKLGEALALRQEKPQCGNQYCTNVNSAALVLLDTLDRYCGPLGLMDWIGVTEVMLEEVYPEDIFPDRHPTLPLDERDTGAQAVVHIRRVFRKVKKLIEEARATDDPET